MRVARYAPYAMIMLSIRDDAREVLFCRHVFTMHTSSADVQARHAIRHVYHARQHMSCHELLIR